MEEFVNFICVILGVIIGLLVYDISLSEAKKDSAVFRELAKPCLEQGYTKAKCREMIYIPQEEQSQ